MVWRTPEKFQGQEDRLCHMPWRAQVRGQNEDGIWQLWNLEMSISVRKKMGFGGSVGGVVKMEFCGWKLRVVPREATGQPEGLWRRSSISLPTQPNTVLALASHKAPHSQLLGMCKSHRMEKAFRITRQPGWIT